VKLIDPAFLLLVVLEVTEAVFAPVAGLAR
jgi:hypothetical protein